MIPLVPPPLDAAPARLRVLVVGGGASGVLLAAHLLREGAGRVAITVVEMRHVLGCGVAYSTRDAAHLLNTRVANMSAYADEPEHFAAWLRTHGPPESASDSFVSRATYGHYMQGLLDRWTGSDALACRRAECRSVDVGPRGVVAHLSSGEALEADLAVLATGHALPDAGWDPVLSQPWDQPRDLCDGPVVIVGSGLTMVDQVLSLLAAGHPGPITAVSRRGLLPQVHAPTTPLCWRPEDLPPVMGRMTGIVPVMRWLRAEARARTAAGGDWRDAVDGIRPHLQSIWRALPVASRRTFLRHASAWWEVHRHRMPPSSAAQLAAALADGRLRLIRGRFEGGRNDGQGRLVARIREPGGRLREIEAARMVDCRGVRRDPEAHATPLIAALLASGEARIDPLRLGLDVAPGCAVLRRDGSASGRLYALGPASRAGFWEVTAIPDIRGQAADLARRLLERVAVRPPGALRSLDGTGAEKGPAAPWPAGTATFSQGGHLWNGRAPGPGAK